MSRSRIHLAASRLTAAALIILLAARPAGAQGFFPRGDGDCSAALTAADFVNGARSLGGDSACGNDDCDRDGAVTSADIECSVRCFFGACPSVPDGPVATDVTPITAPDARPLSLLRVSGANLGAADVIKQATIGGLAAPVVELEDPDTLGVVVPAGLPPGPADLILISGDVAGPPLSITIAAPTPLGEFDTYDDMLALMDDLTARVLAFDLEAGFAGNAATVRGAFADIRAAIAEQRAANAADPSLTPERLAEIDEAIDASGVADLLRDAIDEVDALEEEDAASLGGTFPPTIAVRAAAVAGRTIVAAGGIVFGASPLVIAGILVGTIATATGIIFIFVAAATAPPVLPIILSLMFLPESDVNLPRLDGMVEVLAANVTDLNATSLILLKPSGAPVVRAPLFVSGDRIVFNLPSADDQTFCGRIDFVLGDNRTGLGSRPVPLYVRPTIDGVQPNEAFIGNRLDIDLRAGLGCFEQTLAVFENQSNGVTHFREVRRAVPVATDVPDIPLDFYNFRLSVAGFKSNPRPIQIRGISRIDLTCQPTALFVPPKMPDRSQCRVVLVPSSAPFPRAGRIEWVSSNADVGAFQITGPVERDFLAFRPGSATGMVTLTCGNTHACETASSLTASASFTVRDETAPALTLTSTPAAGEVRAGSAIQVMATAVDNLGVKSVQLNASGEAVEGGPQSFTCNASEPQCEATFTVNLKADGFTSTAVSITATATDASDNTASADPLAFTVSGVADTAAPIVTVVGPTEGAIVNAGATVQVELSVRDNGANDTGVKQTLVRVAGPAVANGPEPERLCLPLPMGETTRLASFTIKNAADLALVSDRNVLIVIQATDAAGAGCEDGNASAVRFVRIRAGAPPMITGVPAEVNAGEQMTITGQAFGATQRTSVVTIGGMVVSVVSWSDTVIVVTVPPTASGQSLPVIVTVAALDSNVASTNVLGTGDVQITLTWQDSNDLDIHVIDPAGEEIYYANRSSSSGGILDVDANAGCGSTSTSPRENVFWPTGGAPSGTYTVRVEYFTGCTEPKVASSFAVAVRIDGGAATTLLSGSVGPGNTVAQQSFTR